MDYGTGTEVELPAELTDCRCAEVLFFFIDGDITQYEGITFSIKMESEEAKFEQMILNLMEQGPRGGYEGCPFESWYVNFPSIEEEWSRVVIPFTAFGPEGGGSDTIINNIEAYVQDDLTDLVSLNIKGQGRVFSP